MNKLYILKIYYNKINTNMENSQYNKYNNEWSLSL
jgi:hypothetical protein